MVYIVQRPSYKTILQLLELVFFLYLLFLNTEFCGLFSLRLHFCCCIIIIVCLCIYIYIYLEDVWNRSREKLGKVKSKKNWMRIIGEDMRVCKLDEIVVSDRMGWGEKKWLADPNDVEQRQRKKLYIYILFKTHFSKWFYKINSFFVFIKFNNVYYLYKY